MRYYISACIDDRRLFFCFYVDNYKTPCYYKLYNVHHTMHIGQFSSLKGCFAMPPKPKFTREEIINAALEVVREKGFSALTANGIGDKLGISARPVFTAFKNMEEVQEEVRNAARVRFKSYADKAADYTPAFKKFGMQMILFAKEEPNLYRLLFLTNNGSVHELDEGYLKTDSVAKNALETVQRDYDLEYEEARTLFHHAWIFTFGIGTLYATGMCSFSMDEVNDLLGQNFMAMLARIKSGGIYQATPQPEEKKER